MSKIFGNKLKEIRIERKLKQEDIAKIFNVSKVTIHAWENDKQEPNIEAIRKLCVLFEISSDYLLGLEDESGRKVYNINNNVVNNYGTVNKFGD